MLFGDHFMHCYLHSATDILVTENISVEVSSLKVFKTQTGEKYFQKYHLTEKTITAHINDNVV